MAYTVKQQGGRTDYNYKEFICDKAEDLSKLPVNSACAGSVAYIIATGDVYMLNSKKEWEVQ